MHDKNGTLLKKGDVVTVEFTVDDTSATEEFCNILLRTVEPFYPDLKRRDLSWFNARQCVLKLRAVEPPVTVPPATVPEPVLDDPTRPV